MSAIDDKYAALGGTGGWLGPPLIGEAICPDNVGHFRHFKNGSIYSNPATGAFAVHGYIRDKWAKLGWEKSELGYPTSDETDSPSGHGRFSLFQTGAILWKTGATEAFESHGAIRGHWGVFGHENGWLGFPLTDETQTPDKVGRFNHFEGGSIYWKPSIGAHEVHGEIRDLWAKGGWERNPDLGYPISDEQPHKAADRFSDFENGVVYWQPGHGATTLFATTLGNASVARADMQTRIGDKLVGTLKAKDASIYVQDGPRIDAVSDYGFDGTQVLNREYLIYLKIGYSVDWVPDPDTELRVNMRVELNRTLKAVTATITNYHLHTEVPAPTGVGITAHTINGRLKAGFDPMLNVPQVVQALDDATLAAILSVKVMPNGDLNTYMQF